MEDLIADVLTVARQGQEIGDTELVSLDAIVTECWDAVQTDGASVTVTDDLWFKADRGRVRHLFENLFRNGVEHAGPDVSIRVGPLDNGDGFYVEDDGPGIPAADREQVFESGYTTGTDGLGLGLSIVGGVVVDSHGWTIAVGRAPTAARDSRFPAWSFRRSPFRPNFYIRGCRMYSFAMGTTVKTIELIGNSPKSWEDAAQNALDEANKTIEDIRGVEIESQTANVEDGQIERYKTTLHVAFELQGR